MHKALRCKENVPYCFSKPSVVSQHRTGQKSQICPRFRCLWKIIPGSIHKWLSNDTQSFERHRRCLLSAWDHIWFVCQNLVTIILYYISDRLALGAHDQLCGHHQSQMGGTAAPHTGKINQGLYLLRLPARSREVSKPRDSGLDFSNPSKIRQAPRQQRWWNACQI